MRWGKHGHFTLERARDAFLSKVHKRRSGCWIWTGAIGSHGRYGIVGLAGRHWLAHRAAWFLFNGEDPGDRCVCHKCDNGLCVNPKHLFIGSQGENVRDMETKFRARHPSGEAHGRAKLTVADVRKIRQLHKDGMAIRAIARLFTQVNRTNIAAVVHRKTWLTT